jgi:replicative superfamily II helicase
MDQIISGIKETNLRLTLAFGIGIHHAGLQERDRKTVEELFVNQKIQVISVWSQVNLTNCSVNLCCEFGIIIFFFRC